MGNRLRYLFKRKFVLEVKEDYARINKHRLYWNFRCFLIWKDIPSGTFIKVKSIKDANVMLKHIEGTDFEIIFGDHPECKVSICKELRNKYSLGGFKRTYFKKIK